MASVFVNGTFVPMNYESLAIDATAGGIPLTAAEYIVTTLRGSGATIPQTDHAKEALISVETESLRWTIDGTAPVAATTGHLVTAGTYITIQGLDAIRKFRAIREGGSNSAIKVTYFK